MQFEITIFVRVRMYFEIMNDEKAVKYIKKMTVRIIVIHIRKINM
jgi:hypothetical protein